MEKKNFRFSDVKKARVSDLKVHEFFIKYGLDKLDPELLKHISYFMYFEKPIITEDGYILSHVQDVLAAKQLQQEFIDAVVVSDISYADLIRLINFKTYCGKTKDYRAAFGVLKEIEIAYDNEADWIKEIEGDKRKVQNFLTGFGETSITGILSLDSVPGLFDMIENGQISKAQALEIVKESNKESKSKKSKVKTDSSEKIRDEQIYYQLKKLSFCANGNLYEIEIQDSSMTVFKNGHPDPEVTISAPQNKMDYKENIVGESRYIIQWPSLNKSIHILNTNPQSF